MVGQFLNEIFNETIMFPHRLSILVERVAYYDTLNMLVLHNISQSLAQACEVMLLSPLQLRLGRHHHRL